MRPWGVKRLFRFSYRTRDEVRADIADEFAFHLEMRADELLRTGLDEANAGAQAAREFGDRTSGARGCARTDERLERRRRVGQLAGELRQDARLGARLLGRSPGFAAVAILTLALGIGANTAIYSVLDAVLLRPLPYPEPERLVQVSETQENGSPNNVSGGAFLDWREHQTQFEALALTGRVSRNLRSGGTAVRLTGLEVSHEFLRVLGVSPLLGRGFLPEEDRPGGQNDVVLITEDLWRSRFGADPGIVGQRILLDEIPRTVIGVLPREAWVLQEDSFFVPAVLTPGSPRAARMPHWAVVFGRLAADTTVARADAELETIKRQLEAEYPAFKREWSVVVRPVTEVIGGLTRAPLVILLAAVSLVLLIACANVANLLIARGEGRQQELAVRAALGAGGGRLVRQVLTENVTLATLGGAAGIGVAYLSMSALRQLTAQAMPFTLAPQLDLRVLTFSLGLTLATGLLCGLLPALRVRKPDLNVTLNDGGKRTTAGRRHRTQSMLVVAEVALTVILLASAGLLLRSLAKVTTTDPGFQPERVLAFDVSLPGTTYGSPEKRLQFASRLLERLRGLPGVGGVGTGMAIPFSGGGYGEYFRREGRTDERDVVTGLLDFVSPGYLEALGPRLLAGRRLAEADNRPNGPRVVVISEMAAEQFFPKTDPIGRELLIASDPWRIIGIVTDVVDRRLDAPPTPFAYVPQALDTSVLSTGFSVAIRTPHDPLALAPSVQAELRRLDPGVALANPRALDKALAGSMTKRKVVLALVALFAAAALLLACIGLYGVLAYAVAVRRREIGVRMALGAARGDVIRHVVRGALSMVAIGLLIGLAGALGAARLLASELYRVRGYDPLVLAGAVLTITVVALAASVIPAWKAARVSPATALRAD